jgi:hypothetical protein
LRPTLKRIDLYVIRWAPTAKVVAHAAPISDAPPVTIATLPST